MADNVLRQVAAGQYRADIPLGNAALAGDFIIGNQTNANVVVPAGTTLLFLNTIVPRNTANATLQGNASLQIYDGNASATGVLLYTLAANNTSFTLVNKITLDLPINSGNLCANITANTPPISITWSGNQAYGK